MRRLFRSFRFGVVVLALAFAAPVPVVAQNIGLPLGSRPEAVQIEDLDGNTVDLGQIIGKKPAFIEFWATWCPQCEALQPSVNAAHEQFGDQVEFVIVAVGVNQNPRSIRQHMQNHAVRGTVLFDRRGAAVRAFMAPTTSYVVMLDASGQVVYTGSGGDQDVVAAIQKALPPGE